MKILTQDEPEGMAITVEAENECAVLRQHDFGLASEAGDQIVIPDSAMARDLAQWLIVWADQQEVSDV